MDIASALIRAEAKWSKVGENFAEKEKVEVLWFQTAARLCFRKGRVRNERRKSCNGVQDFPQINRNSTVEELLKKWLKRFSDTNQSNLKTFWILLSPHCWLVCSPMIIICCYGGQAIQDRQHNWPLHWRPIQSHLAKCCKDELKRDWLSARSSAIFAWEKPTLSRCACWAPSSLLGCIREYSTDPPLESMWECPDGCQWPNSPWRDYGPDQAWIFIWNSLEKKIFNYGYLIIIWSQANLYHIGIFTRYLWHL